MAQVFGFESLVMTIAALVLTVVKLWALVDAALRPAAGFVAAGKLTKPGWLVILALALVMQVLWQRPLGLFSIVGTIAAFVYLLDARPAIAEVTRR